MIQYDMSTCKVLESSEKSQIQNQVQALDTVALPTPKLQEIDLVTHADRILPPELAIADVNAFLDTMS